MCEKAIYDDEDKASQPDGCRRDEAFCNRPAEHPIHQPIYWGRFNVMYGCFGHKYVAPHAEV